MQPRPRQALIHIHDLVLADHDHVAIVEVVAAHPPALHEDAVGAVEILDDAALGARDDLAVMAAHEAAVHLQVIVAGAADDGTSHLQRQLLGGATLGDQYHAAHGFPAASRR